MASDLERSSEARELAERLLITLVHALGPRSEMITVLGGLVPEVLTSGQDPPAPTHMGTTDVDVLLAVHLGDIEGKYEALEDVLERVGFIVDGGTEGWRWYASVEGHRVKIEFLCDLDDQPSEDTYRPAGCTVLGALNLRGTRFVAADWTEEVLDGELIDRSGTVRVTVRMAGLAGYLAAKAYAILGRGWAKDYYDFAYVLINNRQGGPQAAASAIKSAAFASELVRTARVWDEVSDRFGQTTRVGPMDYASQSVLVDPTADAARLRLDAVAAAEAFLSALEPGP